MSPSVFKSWLIPAFTALAVYGAEAQIRINEFMAANDRTPVPGAVAGIFDDWIELHNSGPEPADLSGWHLTDNAANPAKWTFPAGTVIPAGGYRIVFASGNNSPDANGNLHTSFSLSAGGEYLGLIRPDLTAASEFGSAGAPFPPQESDVSYGLKPDGLTSAYFATPTPLAANGSDGYLRAAAVNASVKRGFYTAPFTVTLSTATPEAAVYYTLDSRPPLLANGNPAASAVLYDGPVSISTTTVLRAAAVKAAHEPSSTDTQTYVFPVAVSSQTRPAGYPSSWGAEPAADYNVDTAVSQSAEDAERFLTGLRALPALSISAPVAGIFGPAGLYSRPTDENLETAVSAEYFQPAAAGDGINLTDGFQIDCGLSVQGGSSRNPASSIKHSFSLRFRGEYGNGRLNHDLFGAPAVSNFNSLQLRAMYNNSWIHSDAGQRARATMIRDQWMRDSIIAMGQPDGGHGRYVHLYLNGLYWGVYNLHERSNADQYASYSETGGIDPDTVTGYNPGSKTAAEETDFNRMRSAVSSGNWTNIMQRLDVDSYIDFHIMQHFGHNDDLKTDGNWRAAGGGPGNLPWRFYLWDSERVLEAPNNVSSLAVSQDGAGIINGLDHLPEFQVRFADRAWKHLTNGGALTNARNRARFAARVTELDSAIVGESARWGDDRSGTDYTRSGHWLKAVFGPLTVQPTGGVLGATGWFPESGNTHRTNTILTAWKTQTWPGTSVTKLPAVDPPQFSVNGAPQHGGVIFPGGVLTLTGGTGEIYVTTDGSDPRMTGGAVQPGLIPYAAGSSISLTASGMVRTRWFNGTRWSALNEALFFLEPLAQPEDGLRFSEIHYHPAEPSVREQQAGAALSPPRVFEADDFQFLEIVNTGSSAVNLAGSRVTGGVSFTFENTPVPAGGRVVIVKDAVAFAVRYGPAVSHFGAWSGTLARSGEALILQTAGGAALTGVTYSDAAEWPSRADGDGSSLETRDAAGAPGDPANWRSSVEYHGSPGAAGGGTDGRVLINEVLSRAEAPLTDRVELVNTTAAAIDLSGWFLSDSKSNYRKYRIPPGTVLPAGGYTAFDESQFNAPATRAISGFSGTGGAAPLTISTPAHGLATGDVITISGYGGFGFYNSTFQVQVTGPDTFTVPAVFLDDHAAARGFWTPGQPFALNGSEGEDVWLLEAGADGELRRFADHVEFSAALSGESFGRWPDAAGPLTPMTAPTFGAANSGPRFGPLLISEIQYCPALTPEANFEYIEIYNPGSNGQSLANWTLRGDVNFDFTAQTIPAEGRLVVTGFAPSDIAGINAFITAWNVTTPVVLTGPWTAGQSLGNTGGTIRLQRALPSPEESPDLFPQVVEDEVFYRSAAPWPAAPATGAASLNRVFPAAFGSDAASWLAAVPTPGSATGGPVTPGGFNDWATVNGVTGGPGGDPDQDGIPNLAEYALGLNPARADAAALPQPVRESGGMTLSFPRILSRSDVTVTVQSSPDLAVWTSVADASAGTENGVEVRQATVPATAERVFLRLHFSR